MAPAIATKRLRKEAMNMQTDPPPGIIAEPDESDILTWHYALRGPSDTPYANGTYVGKLKFPPEYPMRPPSIYMRTPSGRFEINVKLCMSMSDFHPESWNPLWSVASIIQGVQSFMASTELTTGGLRTSTVEQEKLASVSMEYNKKFFPELFGGDIEAAFAAAEEARAKAQAEADDGKKNISSPSNRRRTARGGRGRQQKDADDDEAKQSENNGTVTAGQEVPPATKELSAEEAEKRRKKNAKKRAKQKAKKAVAISDEEIDASIPTVEDE